MQSHVAQKSNAHSLQEIPLRMSSMNAPPVVGEHIERAKDEDEETGRPFSLEPYRNHTACAQSDDRHQHSPDSPLSLNDESQEEEDEQHPTGKKEADDQKEIPLESILPLPPFSLTISFGRFR